MEKGKLEHVILNVEVYQQLMVYFSKRPLGEVLAIYKQVTSNATENAKTFGVLKKNPDTTSSDEENG